ncbi:MAG TPA: hypothetical protein PLP75_01265 [Burkholderiales bacterium]|nr:hypothetical protein [Burkholderiales bacterium]
MKNRQNQEIICAQCSFSHSNLAVIDNTIKVEYDCTSPARRASLINGTKNYNGLTENQLNELPLSCGSVNNSCEFYQKKLGRK